MSDPDLGDWDPAAKVVFSDDEIVAALRQNAADPQRLSGNVASFFSGLPKPEQQRLQSEAARAKK